MALCDGLPITFPFPLFNALLHISIYFPGRFISDPGVILSHFLHLSYLVSPNASFVDSLSLMSLECSTETFGDISDLD